jgi:hypothetical protein
MAKTAAPGEIDIPHIDTFIANALPDPFDERDLEYRPRLQPLPPQLDRRTEHSKSYVMRQVGSSCTGHALAAVINTVLSRGTGTGGQSRPAQPPHVSAYMLYHLARRYDEFAGEDDAGSSLRGALKGWFNHGVIPEDRWPSLDMDPVPDLDDEGLQELARRWPLGTFYRVNPFRLDDMQSAITELNAICASAVVHDGWVKPVLVRRNGKTMHLIARQVDAKQLGGHAFALVGYNDVGFLVQNSWGTNWGRGGFATLPYEDWLDSAYDAWVTRPGVPNTPFASGRTRTAAATGGRLVTAPAPDLKRLANYVVNVGNQGLLSTTGSFISTPAQVDRIFEHAQGWHDQWLAEPGAARERHVLLYAHGGLQAEDKGLQLAQRNVNWWLNNRIYPLFFAWQSGPIETLMDQLADRVRLPFGLGFDRVEAVDRAVELAARQLFRWMWDEMKENARAASEPIRNQGEVVWPPTPAAQGAMAAMPGASLTALRLAEYARQQPEPVMVHLVGHSAGAVFHAALLQRLVEAGVPVASMALLAPALRVDEFERDVLPHLGANGSVRRFAVFNLSDRLELDDVCGAGGVDVYHKSLLYLVSRALERRAPGQSEAPLLGMARFFNRPSAFGTLLGEIQARGGDCLFSPAALAEDSRSNATSHGGFSGNALTMTSVVMRALRLSTPTPASNYQPNAALTGTEPAPPAAVAPRQPDAAPAMVTAQTHEPGAQPLAETAEPQTGRPTAPAEPARLDSEVAVAPHSGSAIIDVLVAQGWRVVEPSSSGAARHPAGEHPG